MYYIFVILYKPVWHVIFSFFKVFCFNVTIPCALSLKRQLETLTTCSFKYIALNLTSRPICNVELFSILPLKSFQSSCERLDRL